MDRIDILYEEIQLVLKELSTSSVTVDARQTADGTILEVIPSNDDAASFYVHDGGDLWVDFGVGEGPSYEHSLSDWENDPSDLDELVTIFRAVARGDVYVITTRNFLGATTRHIFRTEVGERVFQRFTFEPSLNGWGMDRGTFAAYS